MSDRSEVSTFCEHRMADCKRCNSSNCNDHEFSKISSNVNVFDKTVPIGDIQDETATIENLATESTANESVSNASVFNETVSDNTVTGGSVSLKSFVMTVLFSFSLTYVLKIEKNLFNQ